MPALAPAETSARLLIAVLFGALIGINRDLHGKPAGLRTHSLVAWAQPWRSLPRRDSPAAAITKRTSSAAWLRACSPASASSARE